jgi:hypothetical protein
VVNFIGHSQFLFYLRFALSLDYDGFKMSVAALVELHNDLVREVANIDRNSSSYTVSKMRLCLASNIVVIRDTLGKLDNMVETVNEPITHAAENGEAPLPAGA